MKKTTAMVALALVAACNAAKDQNSQDPQGSAASEGTDKIAAESIQLDPITYALIEEYDLFGAGCSFTPEGSGDPVFVAIGGKAYLFRDGDLHTLAAESNADPMPYEGRTRYDGPDNQVEIKRVPSDPEQTGEEVWSVQGELTVRDARKNVIYRAMGTVDCGA